MSAAASEIVGDAADITAYEWENLSAGKIYDTFHTKGLKLGIHANKMIKVLKEKKELPDDCENTMAKKRLLNMCSAVNLKGKVILSTTWSIATRTL